MSYPAMVQSLPSPMRSALRDPFWIAAIASIGLHGLLWMMLPRLHDSSAIPNEPEIQRKVGVVQLTPAEQTRIPQFDLPAESAIPLPQTSLPSTLTPRQPNSYSFSPLPPQSAIPYPPAFPFSFYIPTPLATPRTYISTTPIARPTPLPSRQATPQSSAQPSPSPTPQPRIEQPNLSGRASTTPIQGLPVNGATPSPRPTLAEENRQLQERYRQLLTYNAQGTSIDEANIASYTWFYRDLRRQSLDDLLHDAINAPYPREACVLRRSAAVAYGVVVSSDDQISGDPRLLQSSGFPIFDQKALEAVRTHTFNNSTAADQVYQVNVGFEYSGQVCPTATVPSPTPTAAPSPAG